MVNFSEKYGYTKVSDVIIREQITIAINNSILNWFHKIEIYLRGPFYGIEKDIWQYFLNRNLRDYQNDTRGRTIVIEYIFNDSNFIWYRKLDLIEFFLSRFKNIIPVNNYSEYVECLNTEFERHNFAYRIIGGKIEEITSKEEAESIETALANEHIGVKTHLKDALAFLSAAQETPNYRSSIHQSISAVEAWCREITNTKTLGEALKKLGKSGVKINPVLQNGFDKIYGYSCGEDGIRHALMDDSNPPTSDEAIFMLVACSAFINYLTKKKSKIE